MDYIVFSINVNVSTLYLKISSKMPYVTKIFMIIYWQNKKCGSM